MFVTSKVLIFHRSVLKNKFICNKIKFYRTTVTVGICYLAPPWNQYNFLK